MVKRSYLLMGLAGPLLYGFTVLLGGWLWEEYDPTAQAISELTAVGAPFKLPLDILFSLSLLLTAGFALAAWQLVRPFGSRLLKVGIGLIFVIAALSFLWAFFPMDPRGAEVTIPGIIHLVLAGIVSPLTILCPILVGRGAGNITGLEGYSIYSHVSGLLIFAFGLLAAGSGGTYLGVYTRLTIGFYQLWIAVTALVFYLCWPRVLTK